MTFYSGMYIGGPRDGKWTSNDRPYIKVPMCHEDSSFYTNEIMPHDKYEIYMYKHVIGLRGTFEIDFWVNEEEFPTAESVFRHVFYEYSKMERSR